MKKITEGKKKMTILYLWKIGISTGDYFVFLVTISVFFSCATTYASLNACVCTHFFYSIGITPFGCFVTFFSKLCVLSVFYHITKESSLFKKCFFPLNVKMILIICACMCICVFVCIHVCIDCRLDFIFKICIIIIYAYR